MNGVIHIDVDEHGDLLVTHFGKTNKFREIEPGIYQNLREGMSPDPFGEFQTIVFKEDPLGRMMIVTDGPMSYSKAPSYATSGYTFLSIILSIVLFLGSIIYWGIAFTIRKIKRNSNHHHKQQAIAKWIAVAVILSALAVFASFAVTSAFDPVYGLPKVYFGDVPWWAAIFVPFPYVMILLAFIQIVYLLLIWRKKYFNIAGRIHYTVLTIAAMNLSWIFLYWNVI